MHLSKIIELSELLDILGRRALCQVDAIDENQVRADDTV